MGLEGAVEGLEGLGGGEPVESLNGEERRLVGVVGGMGCFDVVGYVRGNASM